MKATYFFFTLIFLLIISAACSNDRNKSSMKNGAQSEAKNEADTGFTGVLQSFSANHLIRETTMKNGVKHGLMKTYYASGLLYQTFWYENGLRQDTGKWYFEKINGRVFRTTPFLNDSAHGIQTQYYENGAVRAKLNFVNGLRTPYLEEFSQDGKVVTRYPEVIITTVDSYWQGGTYQIDMKLTDENTKVTFYKGEFFEGLFDPKRCQKINTSKTTGSLVLKKTGIQGNNYVGIIAEILTLKGNNLLVYKKVDLPHNDLK